MMNLYWFLLLLVLSQKSKHSNNWAVVVSTSRYWFNYRHEANALAIYHTVKEAGIPDSQIILMLADDVACNPRNTYKPRVYLDKHTNLDDRLNLYGNDVEVDYRGLDCSVENLLRVLSGRHPADTARSKRLDTDENSNILVYLSGHGADKFLKFHDSTEVQSKDLADVLTMMYKSQRFNEILFVFDTCQASSMYSAFNVPGVVSVASSKVGQSSYSYGVDRGIGLSTSDRFTYFALQFFKGGLGNLNLTSLLKHMETRPLHSDHQYESSLLRSLDDVKLSDFFSAINTVHLASTTYDLKQGACSDQGEQNVHFSLGEFSTENERLKDIQKSDVGKGILMGMGALFLSAMIEKLFSKS